MQMSISFTCLTVFWSFVLFQGIVSVAVLIVAPPFVVYFSPASDIRRSAACPALDKDLFWVLGVIVSPITHNSNLPTTATSLPTRTLSYKNILSLAILVLL